MRLILVLSVTATLGLMISCGKKGPGKHSGPSVDWGYYLGGQDANHYSSLNQITTENAARLQPLWTYHCGDADTVQNLTQIQCNPLVIDGVLYGTSPKLRVFALDAATGKEIWSFNPFEGTAYDLSGMGVNRGLMWWQNGEERRLLVGIGSYVYALDPATGKPFADFGQQGRADLREGLGRNPADLNVLSTTPGVVYRDLVIMGTRVSESEGAAPGFVRAYHVRTGKIAWTFHTIPNPGQFGFDTWPRLAWLSAGGANSWAGMSIDTAQGTVFVPTGSATDDFYGANRHGANLFANCLLALDAATGKRKWHFQAVHHDLWDRDLPAPPNLVTLNQNGKTIQAVAQITKSGYVFLFDRKSGEPLFPIEEIPAQPSKLPGEKAWATQPLPTSPPPFARQRFAKEDITKRTPEASAYVESIWNGLLKGKPFIPPSTEGTILFPGFDGGGEWGGAAVAPDGIMYVNASEMPWILQMVPAADPAKESTPVAKGRALYQRNCMLCHGKDGKGAALNTVPSLVGLNKRRKADEVIGIIRKGQRLMPAFPQLKEDEVKALAAFLLEAEVLEAAPRQVKGAKGQSYVMNGYVRFKDQDGFPAITPPWGTLSAIDLNQGKILWQKTLGHHPNLPADAPLSGCENYGGPVVTAGNLIFIAATMDAKIRAFDRRDGRQLWEAPLPAAGFATPSTYMVNGKQYVVVACGGGKVGVRSGDAYVAFGLED